MPGCNAVDIGNVAWMRAVASEFNNVVGFAIPMASNAYDVSSD